MKQILHKTAMTENSSSKPIASQTLNGANVVLKILRAEIRSAEKRVARTTSLDSPTMGKTIVTAQGQGVSERTALMKSALIKWVGAV
jgi:hypothetical protein